MLNLKKFLFIIPRTPPEFRDPTRDLYWELCKQYLLDQKSTNWTALVIDEEELLVDNIVSIKSSAKKKHEKINTALEIILQATIKPEYIIRLDDDDLINPNALAELEEVSSFDIYTDKWHTSWNPLTNQIASRVNYWFPNTCIINTKHALTYWDALQKDSLKFMINNNHGNFHFYFRKKKVVFAPKNRPLYLRTISANSITANATNQKDLYLKSFGLWKNRNLEDFPKIVGNNKQPPILQVIKDRLENLSFLRNYNKIVLSNAYFNYNTSL